MCDGSCRTSSIDIYVEMAEARVNKHTGSLPNVPKRTNRPYDEMNFHFTQFLSVHGRVRWNLHRFGHVGSLSFSERTNCDKTVEHEKTQKKRNGGPTK